MADLLTKKGRHNKSLAFRLDAVKDELLLDARFGEWKIMKGFYLNAIPGVLFTVQRNGSRYDKLEIYHPEGMVKNAQRCRREIIKTVRHALEPLRDYSPPILLGYTT
jgi:hypothetical protein